MKKLFVSLAIAALLVAFGGGTHAATNPLLEKGLRLAPITLNEFSLFNADINKTVKFWLPAEVPVPTPDEYTLDASVLGPGVEELSLRAIDGSNSILMMIDSRSSTDRPAVALVYYDKKKKDVKYWIYDANKIPVPVDKTTFDTAVKNFISGLNTSSLDKWGPRLADYKLVGDAGGAAYHKLTLHSDDGLMTPFTYFTPGDLPDPTLDTHTIFPIPLDPSGYAVALVLDAKDGSHRFAIVVDMTKPDRPPVVMLYGSGYGPSFSNPTVRQDYIYKDGLPVRATKEAANLVLKKLQDKHYPNGLPQGY